VDIAQFILAINQTKLLNKLSDLDEFNGSVPNPRLYKGSRPAGNKQEIDLQCSYHSSATILKQLEDS
jgi:hypothetical protein